MIVTVFKWAAVAGLLVVGAVILFLAAALGVR